MDIQKIAQSQPNHKQSTEDIFHIGVKTIIRNSAGSILLLKVEKGSKNYWDLPGGRIQRGESPEETARREIAEETGITTITTLLHVGMAISTIRIPLSSEENVGLIFSFYSGHTSENLVILSSEHVDYVWMEEPNALEILSNTYGKPFIKSLLNKQT